MDNYYWWWRAGWILRLALLASLLLLAIALANCSSRGVQGTLQGTVADPAIELGRSSSRGTGTQTPQGGTDEKSDTTPASSAK